MGRIPDVDTPPRKAWDAFSGSTTGRVPDFPDGSAVNTAALTRMTSVQKFDLFTGLFENNPKFKADFNKKLAEFDFDGGKKYEFDANNNFVEKTDAPDAPDATTVKKDPPATESLTTDEFNSNIPAAKKDIQDMSNQLKKSPDPEVQALGKQIDDLVKNNDVPNLSKTELDKLKKIINDASTTVKGKLSKVGEIVGNNKVFFAIFAAFLCYEGYNRRKKKAEKNREECIAQCKPFAFDKWKSGVITVADLSDPSSSAITTDLCPTEDGKNCWKKAEDGDKTDQVCSAAVTSTPESCTTHCETHCKDKYPLPDPSDMFSSENLSAGVNELGENALDTAGDLLSDSLDSFVDMFKKLFSGGWITGVFFIILGILAFVIIFPFLLKPSGQQASMQQARMQPYIVRN